MKDEHSYCFEINIFLHHVPNVNKANKILPFGIMIGQVLSGQLTKQLIQDLDCSIALNKGVCLGSEFMRYGY